MSVKDIASFIRGKGKKIKEGKGDEEHKKRTGSAKFLPAFIVSILIQIATFLTSNLGISLPGLGLKKDQFGSAVVTSLGMLNFDDATAPFSGFTNAVVFASICAVKEAPVVEDGKIVVGRQMQVNFTVDHRYVDGGRAKTFVEAFKRVFQNPEKYVDLDFSVFKKLKFSGQKTNFNSSIQLILTLKPSNVIFINTKSTLRSPDDLASKYRTILEKKT